MVEDVAVAHVSAQRDQVGRVPNHEVETFPLVCRTTVDREIMSVGHLDGFDVGEELADSVVELNVDLEQSGQVEGAELGEHERGEQLDGRVTQRYAHFVF